MKEQIVISWEHITNKQSNIQMTKARKQRVKMTIQKCHYLNDLKWAGIFYIQQLWNHQKCSPTGQR